jgi:ABC-type nitrate/sulfonate/bicarbonate transport system substrate-binding protein
MFKTRNWILILLIILSGCSSAQPNAATPSITRTGKIRASLGVLDVSDIPYLMALDMLKTQGYQVESIQFDQFELISAAMAKGDLEFAGASRQTTWSAIAKGASIREIITKSKNYYVLLTTAEIKTCADLNGKRLAVGGASGVVVTMVNKYLKEKCPGVTPQIIIIASTASRTAALLAGQIDATPVEYDNLLRAEKDAPGRYHALVDFAKEFPMVDITGYYVNPSWASKNPIVVKDFLRALIQARRQIQDKQVLRQVVTKYFGADDTSAQTVAESYLARNIWDVNGGLTIENVQYMMDFFVGAGALAPGLRPEDIADLSYLNAVVEEIGRK